MSGVSFTRSAETDLLELWLHIAEENLVAADESLDVIQAGVSILSSQPEMGRARPELADGLHSFPTCTPYIGSWLCHS
jgi:plasmid stabilization system protein ParE